MTIDRIEAIVAALADQAGTTSQADALVDEVNALLPLLRQWADAAAEVQRTVLGASSRKRVAERHLLAFLRGDP